MRSETRQTGQTGQTLTSRLEFPCHSCWPAILAMFNNFVHFADRPINVVGNCNFVNCNVVGN